MCHIQKNSYVYIICGHTFHEQQESRCALSSLGYPRCHDADIDHCVVPFSEPCPFCTDDRVEKRDSRGVMNWVLKNDLDCVEELD